MPTLKQIQSQIEKLQKQAEVIALKANTSALRKIAGLMSEHGLTVDDIVQHLGAQKRRGRPASKSTKTSSLPSYERGRRKKATHTTASKGKLPPKFRNPETGETWSGHARPPKWIAEVKDRSAFLIESKNSKPQRTARTLSKKSAGQTASAKQSIAYRDPVSGKTWNGHGRAPAWIKDAPDRAPFVDGATS